MPSRSSGDRRPDVPPRGWLSPSSSSPGPLQPAGRLSRGRARRAGAAPGQSAPRAAALATARLQEETREQPLEEQGIPQPFVRRQLGCLLPERGKHKGHFSCMRDRGASCKTESCLPASYTDISCHGGGSGHLAPSGLRVHVSDLSCYSRVPSLGASLAKVRTQVRLAERGAGKALPIPASRLFRGQAEC